MAVRNQPAAPAERELTLTRVFDAPRELVFEAWTDPRHMARWWGPKDFTNPVCEIDARPGGAIYIVMRGPEGTEYPMRGEFREIRAPERLVFTAVAVDPNGKPLLEGLVTVTFLEIDGKTAVTMHERMVALVPDATRMCDGAKTGWAQSLDRLAELLTNLK